MYRRSWRALASLLIASAASSGCGDSAESGQVERSEAAIRADSNSQDAMRAFMQSKKGSSKKAASKKAEAKPEAPPAEEAAPE
ncbi:hypothetical protein [Paludisphaera sp.]|uniref:hypothetical protein n=1 Tax=Paludisphaera sp. TaxID=2017432 RepID=UPI00301D3CE3